MFLSQKGDSGLVSLATMTGGGRSNPRCEWMVLIWARSMVVPTVLRSNELGCD